jgi:hypothetical protein
MHFFSNRLGQNPVALARDSDDAFRMPRKIGNLPTAPLRWPIDRAVEEFGQCTASTLRKLLGRNGAQPAADGTFSTQAIASAIYGGLHEEKLLTQRELTKKLKLENAIVESTYLNRVNLEKALAQVADAIVSIIKRSALSRSDQEDLQRELASIPLGIESVARSQSKLKRSQNGRDDKDESES